MRTLKGGSFLNPRDGEDDENGLKIRISARIGLQQSYTAQNVGFRCAQTIENVNDFKKKLKKENQTFRIVRLRPPMHHGTNGSYYINDTKSEIPKQEL